MKILFVYSLTETQSASKPLITPESINFGISYIASLLKENGHEPDIVVLSPNRKSFKILGQYIKEFNPKIVGFSIIATQFAFLTDLAKHTKKLFPNIYLIAGGPHVSINPDQVISGPFDAICIGEGEYPTLELVQKLNQGEPITNIANLWIRSGNKVEKNTTRPFLEDLDALPYPNRNMWFRWIDEHIGSRFSILLGRGCHFDCTYCSNHVLRKVANGQYVRFRSPDNIISEIRDLHDKFPDKQEYFFEIEAININKKWMFDLCEKLKTFNDSLTKPLVFGTNMRITPNADFEEIFVSCVKANIRYLTVGLESGSDRIRREVMNRIYSNDDVIRMAKQAREHGLRFGFQNMIGLPDETEEDFWETIKLNRLCQPDWYYLSIFFPYPGTKLANLCEERGLIRKSLIDHAYMERKKLYLDMPVFPFRRLIKRYYLFEYDVFKGKKSLLSIAARILQRICLSHDASSKIYRRIASIALMQKLNQMLGIRN
ncbi:MAG TPA: radical SAM protein [Desulfobacterales bacterium]|nr:radical SAM protein [Desulfobacterales bacterium]